MVLARRIKHHSFLPVLIVLFILSIESITVVILQFIGISIKLIDSNLLFYSEEFLDIVIMTFAKGFGLLVLILLIHKKLRGDEIKTSSEIKLRKFLIIIILVYIGCTSFLMENLNSSLLIFSDKDPVIKVWPEITLSRISIGYLGYQVFLILLLFGIMPIFEELLYRKAIIQALLKKGFRLGWITIISAVIYAIAPFLSNLIMYSEERAIWAFFIQLISGFFLAIVFLKTKKVKYPILLKTLVNLNIYFHFLTMFHPVFSPFRGFYLIFLFCFYSFGIFILFYIVIDGIVTFRSSSSFPWFDSLLDFSFSDGILKPLFSSIFIFLPVIPLGWILLVDHTILYTDLVGILIKTITKSFLLGVIVLVCGIQIKTNNELYEAYSEPLSSVKFLLFYVKFFLILREKQLKFKENLKKFFYKNIIKTSPRVVIRHLGLIFLIIGSISPLFHFSMGATIFTRIPGFGTIMKVDLDMITGQNPFFSYSQVEMISRSPLVPFIPIRKTEGMFYVLKHSNAQWNFLPDTFMAHPGDWIHGLMTVGTWFLIILLLYFAILEYSRNRRIIAGFLVIFVLGTELLWYLLTLGIGSIPSGEEPPPPSTNQTLAEIFQMDFEINDFFILPLGLIIFLIAALIILYSGVRYHLKEKRAIIHLTSENEKFEDFHESNDVLTAQNDSIS